MLHKIPTTFPVTICYIPAHRGISGNEAADKAAKEATKDRGESLQAVAKTLERPLPSPLRLVSVAKTVVRREARVCWPEKAHSSILT